MKSLSNDNAHHVRVRVVVAYPAVSVALVVSIALALTSFGPSRITAMAASTAPDPGPAATAAPTTTPSPPATRTTPGTTTSTPAGTSANPSPTANPSASSAGVGPAAAPVNHHVLGRIEGSALQANYLPVDEIVPDATRFQTFRVRFQLHNTGTTPISVTPQLEYRPYGSSGYTVVPAKPLRGIPLRLTREWVPSPGRGGGTVQGPLAEDIAVADLRIGQENRFAVNGHRSMGANPDRPVTLPSDSYTEQEFTISLTMDAKYLTGYELRITDGGNLLAGTEPAHLRLGEPPVVKLSPGQHQGIAVGGPRRTIRTGVVK